MKEVCREFNMQSAPSTQQWEAASKHCKLLMPLQEMSVIFEVPDPMQHFKANIYLKNSAFANAGPLPSWNLEVQNWNPFPAEVFECYMYLLLKSGFQT